MKTYCIIIGLVSGIVGSTFCFGRTWVLPTEAIQASQYLSAQVFRAAYPGIAITEYLVREGWYVRYTHEKLTYLFGPIETLENAHMQTAFLKSTRRRVIEQRPSLSTSRVDLINFSLETGTTLVETPDSHQDASSISGDQTVSQEVENKETTDEGADQQERPREWFWWIKALIEVLRSAASMPGHSVSPAPNSSSKLPLNLPNKRLGPSCESQSLWSRHYVFRRKRDGG